MIAQHSIDELLQHILPHVKQHVNKHTSQFKRRRPYLLALTGLQGSGKTTWTTDIVRTLNEQHNLRTIYVSLDDFYLDHDGLLRVREENPSNKLLRVRGQPGTHDVALARQFFNNLFSEDDAAREVLIPEFDKSRFNGEGDRVPEEHWKKVRVSPESAMDVIVLEGWCVGFQPLDESTIEEKWKEANYIEINRNLKIYCDVFMGPQHLDYLVHLDTDDLMNVYRWRLEQEHALRKSRDTGMSDEQVVSFVECYMPAYELYLDYLRQGFFNSLPPDERAQRGHIRAVLGREREIVGMATCG